MVDCSSSDSVFQIYSLVLYFINSSYYFQSVYDLIHSFDSTYSSMGIDCSELGSSILLSCSMFHLVLLIGSKYCSCSIFGCSSIVDLVSITFQIFVIVIVSLISIEETN